LILKALGDPRIDSVLVCNDDTMVGFRILSPAPFLIEGRKAHPDCYAYVPQSLFLCHSIDTNSGMVRQRLSFQQCRRGGLGSDLNGQLASSLWVARFVTSDKGAFVIGSSPWPSNRSIACLSKADASHGFQIGSTTSALREMGMEHPNCYFPLSSE
jgi:hypothetical protein